jgi:hypothetical protein
MLPRSTQANIFILTRFTEWHFSKPKNALLIGELFEGVPGANILIFDGIFQLFLH